jgi:hypothetical protein
MGLARRLDDRMNRHTKKDDYLQKKTTILYKQKHQRQILCGQGTFKNTTNMNLFFHVCSNKARYEN